MFAVYKRLSLIGLAILAFSSLARAEPLRYEAKGQKFEGFILRAKAANAPAILMVHNWMGVSAETKTQAERFQALGYTVMAADIYGAGVRPKDANDASIEATKYKKDRALFRERLLLALETLKAQPGIDTNRIAAIGYCFGGTGVIELARTGAVLNGVISFHGGLDSPTPADGAKIRTRILALHGADDPFVPAKDLAAFEAEMKAHKVNYQLDKLPGAVHSFTEKGAGNEPKKGFAYNATADASSFEIAKGFLKTALK